jgi:hypothetical protein
MSAWTAAQSLSMPCNDRELEVIVHEETLGDSIMTLRDVAFATLPLSQLEANKQEQPTQ